MALLVAAVVRGASVPELDALAARESNLGFNWTDQEGRSALHHACSVGDVEVVSWLLRRGADVGLRALDGSTILHAAAAEGHTELLLWLHSQTSYATVLRALAGECVAGRNAHQVALSNGHLPFARTLEQLVMAPDPVKHRSFGLHVAFDIGTSAEDALDAKHVLVSHSHIDHIGALLAHARARSLGSRSAKYYVPHAALEPLLQAKAAYEVLDGGPFEADITAVGPGDEIPLCPTVKAVVFATEHRVPSQGYALVREKRLGLKQEYKQLQGRELGALRKQGVQVCEVEEVVELAFTGDTVLRGVLAQKLPMRARLLLMECTYLDGDRALADKHGHVHIQDLAEHAAAFASTEHIVLTHLSRRYKGMPHAQLAQLLAQALPPALLPRLYLALAPFGRAEAVTSVESLLLESMATAATPGSGDESTM